MVCIDEVVAYFKTLKSYERLWMMCRLQSHCLPIELRYLGTCLDNLSKRDIHVLKKLELEANDPANVSEVACKCICDKTVRAAVIKYLSVLNANSTKCSEIIYKALTDEKGLERIFKSPKTFFNDKNTFEELMVLYTLAVNHPAFLFEQKTQLDSIFNCIKKEKERQISNNKDGDSDSKESSKSLESINTMIPPPNYMYQQTHGGSNFPLNRNGYIYPRQYFPCPPINVPPMQVCHDYPPPPPPPPPAVTAIRGPHQTGFSKSPSPVSWPPRTFQINNPRSQPPPNNSSKQRHPTPPRFRSPPDAGFPFTQTWNSWNMYQMSPQNVYTNYNYNPGVMPPFFHENTTGRNFQGQGTKNKHVATSTRPPQEQLKNQMPNSLPNTTPNKNNASTKNDGIHSQMTSSDCSKSSDTSQPSSYRTVSSSVPDNVPISTPQSPIKSNATYNSPKPTQFQTPVAKTYNLKNISENKKKPDNVHQTVIKFSQTSPKNFSSSTNIITSSSQVMPNNQRKEQTKNIDLSSLSTVLEDSTTENASVMNSNSNESLQKISDKIQQNTKIGHEVETNTKVSEGKEVPVSVSMKPSNSSALSNFNSNLTKYYKGRSIQSQTKNLGRESISVNAYNRKSLDTAQPPNELRKDNINKQHSKGNSNNSNQHYYTMSYDNGAGTRTYNAQTYYVHQAPTPQPISGFPSIPRPYLPQQHVIQSPEYPHLYQPAEFLYYPSSSQTFYTTPVLMQPPVLAYHPPKVSCYNCGGQNHTGAECTELTMEEITSKGLYENHFGTPMADGRHHN
ncbi:uncharacterized protein LOC126897706 isoform X2 [Daktulosphaira vitifoliae]|uniref:uncharacterized protein LOC126897706 isoform X2 n=1 Tax=Daktulosphaira vitifoliae TaxID=58002 RepID=UPI0021A9937D|nr:uncharacterized protein LOC126897706 isoform X2 [Daktulosphaira vitifoliae]